jgi:hypothetical protein
VVALMSMSLDGYVADANDAAARSVSPGRRARYRCSAAVTIDDSHRRAIRR